MTLEICSEGSCPIPLFLKGDASFSTGQRNSLV